MKRLSKSMVVCFMAEWGVRKKILLLLSLILLLSLMECCLACSR